MDTELDPQTIEIFQEGVEREGDDTIPVSAFPAFGEYQFAPEEYTSIQEQLSRKLNKEEISSRPGPGNQKLYYLEAWRAAEIANSIFGFNGWCSSVVNLSHDYVEVVAGKVNCGISALVRITLKDGSYHEDIGYGISENQKTKGAALEKAKKEAVSDGMKRALRLFGNVLGNSIYDKEHVKQAQRAPAQQKPPNSNPNAATNGTTPQNGPPAQTVQNAVPHGYQPNNQTVQNNHTQNQPYNSYNQNSYNTGP